MKKYWVAFGSVPNIRSEHWQKVISYFPKLEDAWNSRTGDLLSAGLSERWIDNFSNHRKKVIPDKLMENLYKNQIDVINITEDGYPPNLKEIYTPPILLYIKGELTESEINSIAIVGSRKGTDYGKRATFEIAKELSKSGVTVVSGLALGLDTEAHKGALSGGGRTIAVLANGLNFIYPTSNTELGKLIINNGCLISEQPPDMPALRQNFPARNRIISGLSLGTLITEAGEHSGTLHTASFAIEQNRQIYAIPGPIYNPLAKGPNNLLKNGAKAVTESSDILEDFGIETKSKINKPENSNEALMFEILKNENLHIDEITKKSKLEPSEISKILTMMEITGKIRHLGGMIYSLC
jgi:DNA processing protein